LIRFISKLHTVQNLNIVDRFLRIVLGAPLLAMVIITLREGDSFGWHAYLMLVAIYPLMTAIMGWDPVYSMVRIRSCNKMGRLACGTFPYQLDAVFGNKPIPHINHDHSLNSSGHAVEAVNQSKSKII
jgi:hypothetical protein